MIKRITNKHIRELYWRGFLEVIFDSLAMNAQNLIDDTETEPLVFTREVQDKQFQLESLRKKLWE